MRRKSRVMQQRYEEQRTPEEDVSGGDDDKHAHASHALALHPRQIASKTTATS